MRRSLVLALIGGALGALGATASSTPAAAQRNYVYPYCLSFYEGVGRYSHQECSYVSMAQCRASSSGRGGQCDQNPAWIPQPQPVKKSRRPAR